MIRPDHDASLRFLRLLYPEGPWVLTAIHPTNRSDTGDAETRTRTFSDPAHVEAFLAQHAAWNLYYTVNRVVETVHKKPERHEIAGVHYLHVDVDAIPGEDLAGAWEGIRAKLSHPPGGLPPPTALVRSGGGGANALWALAEPIIIDGVTPVEREASADNAKSYSHQIELVVGGADACHNVDRILRLPGTLNWPTARKTAKYGRTEPALAELVFWEAGRVYPLAKFARAPTLVATRHDRAGPTRHEYSAGGNIARVEDLSTLDLSMLTTIGRNSDDVLLTIRTGQPPTEFLKRWGNDRSKMVLWLCCELVRASVPDDKIYAIITDPAWPVSAHVLEQRSGVKRYAERQIGRAHDRAIHESLDDLNTQYAAIEDVGGKCVIIKEVPGADISFLSPSSFREFFANRFVEVKRVDNKGRESMEDVELGGWWWRHPMRRQFERMGFEPERKVPGMYNLWRGFGVDAVPGEWGLFRDLMLTNLCRGDLGHYDYLIKWLAHGFQNPGEPGYTAVVLQGIEGTGKGTFGHTIGAMWGAHYYHLLDGVHLTGQFTGHLADKAFVFADEAFFAGDHRNVAKLQGYVTEPVMTIEDKYLRARTVKNTLKILIASNKDWVVSASASARRYFVLRTADLHHEQVSAQRKAIDRQMANGGLAGLLHDLRTMDLSGFDIRKVPQTAALRAQKELSMSIEQTWWMNKLYSGELLPDHASWEQPIMVRRIVDDYMAHHRNVRGRGMPMPESQLGRFIAESVPVNGKSLRYQATGGSRYRFPSLRVCREHWDIRMNAKFDWPEEPVEQPRERAEPF